MTGRRRARSLAQLSSAKRDDNADRDISESEHAKAPADGGGFCLPRFVFYRLGSDIQALSLGVNCRRTLAGLRFG